MFQRFISFINRNYLYLLNHAIIIQIQPILSHREHHHNIKLRQLHKKVHHNDSDLESTIICGKICMASFTLMVLFYLCMAAYIIRYYWKINATRKSREIRYGFGNELRMYSQLHNNNDDNEQNEQSDGGGKGRKNETVVALVYEGSRS